ncbi:hypothetical protein [Bartonella ancashensis]|uniref:Uncharacterized protein n=1 Tax=Bartonella ancashensis TaxID=1318743 RepID=A0A0M4LRZ6_9HYPH|nr:hypothetical protein [Bartonella ancashensis]ALE03097.1 hypothetical protein PU02_0283 [Bartonella ancashensis]
MKQYTRHLTHNTAHQQHETSLNLSHMESSSRKKSSNHHSYSKTQASPTKTHDHHFQSSNQGNSRNSHITTTLANAHSRPIALLYAKGHISKAQYKAAEHFYGYWYKTQGETHMGFDYTRPRVECTHDNSHNIERQIDADKQLQMVKIQLGVLGYRLIEQVVGYGQAIKDLSSVKRKQNSLADHLRDCLDLMAIHWGYSTKTPPNAP